jgi:hypothetical protein
MAYNFETNPQAKQFYAVYLRRNGAVSSVDESIPAIVPPMPRSASELVAQTRGLEDSGITITASSDGSTVDYYKSYTIVASENADITIDTDNFGVTDAEGSCVEFNLINDSNLSSLFILHCNRGADFFINGSRGLGVTNMSIKIVGYNTGTAWEFYVAQSSYLSGGNTHQEGLFEIGAVKSGMSIATNDEGSETDTKGNLIKLSEKITADIVDMNCTKDNYSHLRAMDGGIDIFTVSLYGEHGNCVMDMPTFSYLGISKDDGFLTSIKAEKTCRNVDDFFVTY